MNKFNAADHIYAIDEGDNGVYIGGIPTVDKHIESQDNRIAELEAHIKEYEKLVDMEMGAAIDRLIELSK